MIDATVVEHYVREANPIPHAGDVDADELARSAAAVRVTMAAAMETSTSLRTDSQHPTTAVSRLPNRSSRPRSGWTAAIAAAVLVIMLIGGVAWLTRIAGDDSEPADLTPTTDQTTLTLETTTAPETPGTTIAGFVDTEPVDYVPGLGSITWTKLEGNAETLPQGPLAFDPDYGYYSTDPLRHQSDDGLAWTSLLSAWQAVFDDYRYAGLIGTGMGRPWMVNPNWAIAVDSSSLDWVFEREGAEWVAVDVLEVPTFDTVGIEWVGRPKAMIESGDIALMPTEFSPRAPWNRIYEGFSGSDWSKKSRTLIIKKSTDEGETTLATLTIEVAGDTARFVDVETGELVHEVIGSDTTPVERLVEGIKSSYKAPGRAGVWVSTGGSDFEFHQTPWKFTRSLQILVAPDGSGFVATRGGVQTWASPDGRAWSETEPAPFRGHVEELLFVSRPGELHAFSELHGETPRHWVSNDAVTWSQGQEFDLPHYVLSRPASTSLFGPTAYKSGVIYATEFGFAATTYWPRDSDPNLVRYWVSLDGDTWVEVEGPPGPHDADRRLKAGGTGSILYMGFGKVWPRHSLWVGRFES